MLKILSIAIKVLVWLAVIVLLVFISQTGVLAIFLYLPLSLLLLRRIASKPLRRIARLCAFVVCYLIICFGVTPLIAHQQGRVRLPLGATDEVPLGPRSLFFVLAQRNYCQPVVRDALILAAQRLREENPAVQIAYLDVGWPMGGTKFFPHISHGDGHKADIAFLYHGTNGEVVPGKTPTPFGYGSFDLPVEGELDKSKECLKTNPYYSFCKIWRWRVDRTLKTDEKLTRRFILLMAKDPHTVRILIEPHLRKRWRLQDVSKMGFAGCGATRHDDHIHVEVR
jgi:hypothetical protein